MNLDELERLHKHVNKNWHAAKTGEIGHLYSALNQAFPALLALAMDGERYRWLMAMRYHLGEETSKNPVFVDPVFMAIKSGHPPDQKSINAFIDAMKERT